MKSFGCWSLSVLLAIPASFPFSGVPSASALDWDGTANLNLTLTANSDPSVIVGKDFNLSFSLKNEASSDGDAYNYGVLVKIPQHVTYLSADSGLGSPTRQFTYSSGVSSGSTMLFFETSSFLPKTISQSHTITLRGGTNVPIATAKTIQVMAYAEDNAYGRGLPPTGSPLSTLSGGVDYANSVSNATDLTFPDNVTTSTDISWLPFVSTVTTFVPYDVTKSESASSLVSETVTSTLVIKGNSLWPVKNVHLRDVVPSNRKFDSVLSLPSGTATIVQDSPSAGETTVDFDGITVPTNSDVTITYRTTALSHALLAASGSVFDSWSLVTDGQPSQNTVTSHTGILTGGAATTWNNGTSDIPVTSSTLPSPKNSTVSLQYASLSKSNDRPSAAIGDQVTFTVAWSVARNVDLTSDWSGTYVLDVLPDGFAFDGNLSSSIVSGSGTALSFVSADVLPNGDTEVLYRLNSWIIEGGSTFQFRYRATVNGAFEWSGPTAYENLKTLTNTATLEATAHSNSNSGDWGYSDSATDFVHVTKTASSSVKAPAPTETSTILSIRTPDGTTYDSANPYSNQAIPVGSVIEYAITMDFPKTHFLNAYLRDSVPLLVGHKENLSGISFISDLTQKDVWGNPVGYNTNDTTSGVADTDFNGLSPSWTVIPNAAWISTSEPNNIEFNLGSRNSGTIKPSRFAIKFKGEILPQEPAEKQNGLAPMKNVVVGYYENEAGALLDPVIQSTNINVSIPNVTVTKTASWSSIVGGKPVDYAITFTNNGKAPAFLESILDSIPSNLTILPGGTVTSSGGTVSGYSISQTGTGVSISFSQTWSQNRSYIKENESVTVRYSVLPDAGFVIKNGDARNSTVTADYYSTPDATSNQLNNYGPISASASFTVGGPSMSRSITSTSETDSAGTVLYVGEEATYRSIVTLPGGTYETASFTETNNASLQLVSINFVSASGSISFSNGTTFTGSTSSFWTVTNTDLDTATAETFIVDAVYRVKTTATAGSKTDTASFAYSSTNLSGNLTPTVAIPTITFTKTASVASGDSSDTVTYTVTVSNSAAAHAYDVSVWDNLPAVMLYQAGTLSVSGGAHSWDENSFFVSNSWVVFDVIPPSSSRTITFAAKFSNGSVPGNTVTNTASGSYGTIPDETSPNRLVKTGSATRNVTVSDATITSVISATDVSETTSSAFSPSVVDAAVGETVTYDITVTLPRLFYTGTTVTQTVPAGLKILSGSVVSSNVVSATNSAITVNGAGTGITFDFGNVDNIGGSATGGYVLRTQAAVLDHASNTAGTSKSAVATLNYSSKSKSATANVVEIVEPNLSVTKSYAVHTGDGGDVIATTVTVANSGTSPAYDVTYSDSVAPKTSVGAGYSANANYAKIDPGQTVVFNYDTTIDNSIVIGDVLTSTASVSYDSFPGTAANGERSASRSSSDTIVPSLSGGLSVVLLTPGKGAIGDTVRYRVTIPVFQGTVGSLTSRIDLPYGVVADASSLEINASAGVINSGSSAPAFTPDSGIVGTDDQQRIDLSFGSVTNPNTGTSQDSFTVEFDAKVVNSARNSIGDSKTVIADANYDAGATYLSGASAAFTVLEPVLSVALSTSYVQGKSVTYRYVVTNTGTSTARDSSIDATIPSGVAFSGNVSVISSGTVASVTRSGNSFSISNFGNNSGNPLVFEIDATIDESVPDGTVLVHTGTLTYTSQAGTYSALIGNPLDTERTGDLSGQNDYWARASVAVTYKKPAYVPSISVTDLNGGDGVIGDEFEYVLTVTNTGSMPLTGINVVLDVLREFSDFTVVSIPTGSVDHSTATGGSYGSWLLDVRGISLALSGSEEIRFRVKARTDLGTMNVLTMSGTYSDSSEGAVGWVRPATVTIHAPRFETPILLTDVNGGSLYDNETFKTSFSVKNTGTSTGNQISVSVSFVPEGIYHTGSFAATSTGSRALTGTLEVNQGSGTLGFLISSIDPGATETFEFFSTAKGNPGKTFTGSVSAVSDEGPSASGSSNALVIVAPTVSGGGGGGGGGSIPTTTKPTTKPTTVPETPKTETKPETKPIPKKEVDTPKSTEKEMLDIAKRFESKKKRLAEIESMENASGEGIITLPKILPKTGTPVSSRAATVTNPLIETSSPKISSTFVGSDNADVSFWKNALPKQDRDAETILVTPSNGMVIPVRGVPTASPEYKTLVSGREIDVNKYLKSGALKYPGTSTKGYGELGNVVVFGHSNYWKKDDGRYKTLFQNVISLNVGEEIWVYQKNSDGKYSRYRYVTEASYETTADDVGVLNPGIGRNLTLFTCTPIGTARARWIVRAKFVDEEKMRLARELAFDSVPSIVKARLEARLRGLPKKADERKAALVKAFEGVSAMKSTLSTKEYFRMRLAQEYAKLVK